jgi:hypothetical protein
LVDEIVDKGFKLIIYKITGEFKEDTNKQLSELRKTMKDVKKQLANKIDIHRKNQTEIMK